ncbi:MAG: TetR/AcrR family transcriptional regulator C-terminal domain-containing protein [Salaquimonas sp.]
MNQLALKKPEGFAVNGAPQNAADLSTRQREVLAVVLDLMVEEGDGFSMAAVARRASCSKETLYNWFGDRDGLLTATVQWQASKVRLPGLSAKGLTAGSFRDGLIAFAVSWLEVITGDVSAALNRLAVSHAGSGKSRLGEIVLKNGPLAMMKRLRPIFEIGEEAGLLRAPNVEFSLRSFFGLVVADWQIRKLLGEPTKPSQAGIRAVATRAVDEFLVLYGTENANTNNEHTKGE